MLPFVVLCLILTIFTSKEILGDRIQGGTDATIEEFPYMVSVQVNISLEEYDHRCAGSIISENVVLTSASCIRKNGINNPLFVRYGSTQHASGGKLLSVKQKIRHNGYGDIGLLFLNESIQFSEKASCIELAAPTDSAPIGEIAKFSGWGFTSLSGEYPVNLQKITLPIVDIEECFNENKIYLIMICAGYVGIENKWKCRGDEGGPLVWEKKQYGISLWNDMPCGTPLPGLFTEVASYREWIDTNIEQYNKLNNFVTYN